MRQPGDDPVAAFVAASQPADSRLRIIPAPVPRQPLTVVLLGQNGERMILNDFRDPGGWHHDPGRATELVQAVTW